MKGPVIIVTGANSGVGYGICLRLLTELSLDSDAELDTVIKGTTSGSTEYQYSNAAYEPVPDSSSALSANPYASTEEGAGLTIIMACRNRERSSAARTKLSKALDALYIIRKSRGIRSRPGFRENLKIDMVPLDLASVSKTLEFTNIVKKRYSYVSHIICNAGCGPFTGLDVPAMTKQIIFHPIDAVTFPFYKTQSCGDLSEDGLGLTWQSNAFGHYFLIRQLLPQLKAAPFASSRVIWITSLEAKRDYFKPTDWQCVQTKNPYEASKYAIILLASALGSAMQKTNRAGETKIETVIVHPGVTATNIFATHLTFFTSMGMYLLFYIARWLGSSNHVIKPYKGALSSTFAAIAPTECLETGSADHVPIYASACDRLGNEYVQLGFEDIVLEEKKSGLSTMPEILLQRAEMLAKFLEGGEKDATIES